ncbi:transposase [Streptomyces sp. NPDC058572]|uniref:transposase n=1 Tax=Streptomyces sp. NPDC058572 TaxID=3346546 RepID=UPI003646268F
MTSADVGTVRGAEYRMPGTERVTSRNGHRRRDTRAGTVDPALPRPRPRPVLPRRLPERRRRSEQALAGVVAGGTPRAGRTGPAKAGRTISAFADAAAGNGKPAATRGVPGNGTIARHAPPTLRPLAGAGRPRCAILRGVFLCRQRSSVRSSSSRPVVRGGGECRCGRWGCAPTRCRSRR